MKKNLPFREARLIADGNFALQSDCLHVKKGRALHRFARYVGRAETRFILCVEFLLYCTPFLISLARNLLHTLAMTTTFKRSGKERIEDRRCFRGVNETSRHHQDIGIVVFDAPNRRFRESSTKQHVRPHAC